MVGTTGFEPATSRTPSVRATRLRYVPTVSSAYHSDSKAVNKERSESLRSSKVWRLSIASCDDAVRSAACAAIAARILRRAPRPRRVAAPPLPSRSSPAPGQRLIAQVAPRSRNRETFVVQQALDCKYGVDIFAAIQPVPLGAFHRLKHRKLRLPIAQHKGLVEVRRLTSPIRNRLFSGMAVSECPLPSPSISSIAFDPRQLPLRP